MKFPAGPILDPDTGNLLHCEKGVVVFDRDGTLVDDAGQHNDPEQLVLRDGAVDAIAYVKGLGFGVAIASNQAGLETEKFSLAQLMQFNAQLKTRLRINGVDGIDVIAICPHHASSQCQCRKPQTGLFEAIEKSGLGKPVLFVGDTESDRQAAIASKIAYLDVAAGNISEIVKNWSQSHEPG